MWNETTFVKLGLGQLVLGQEAAWVSLSKLLAAAFIGFALTYIYRLGRNQTPDEDSQEGGWTNLQQAQVLLCVSGALVMMVIGDSLARAFGIAGAAAIIRFRTPVENPKDTILLFLLLGLGMACGLGAFGAACMGASFIAALLLVLDRLQTKKPEQWTLEVVPESNALPVDHIQGVLTLSGAQFEPKQIRAGVEPVIKYRVRLDWRQSVDKLNALLLNGGSHGIRSVSWAHAKREK